MCGIFGWQLKSNNLPSSEKRSIIAVALGWQNEERGTDSYGWFDHMTGTIARGVGRIGPRARAMAPHQAIMGHTRHATKGTPTIENAHPFTIGHIIGAHNGIIHNHESLNAERKKAGLPEYEVDSMHLFSELDKGLNIKACHGYGAIEWVDDRDPKCIFLCRMTATADLCVAETAYGIFWSSSDKHLAEAMLVAGIKYQVMESKPEQVYFIQDGRYIKWTDKRLELGSYQGAAYAYSSTPYGSRLPLDEEEEAYIQLMMELRTGGGEDSDEDSDDILFPFLTKKERKKLVKKRNQDPKEKRLFIYKDLCPCGAWIGLGKPHFTHCDKWIPPPKITPKIIPSKTVKIEKKQMFDSAGHPIAQGVMIGNRWCCNECCQDVPGDGYCPSGHGRVVADPARWSAPKEG